MKLKNVRIGDHIQAKRNVNSGGIKRGQIVEVISVEPLYYIGELTALVVLHNGSETWINHKDFHKAYQDGAGK